MVASHNQESIEKATKLMHELDLPPRESPVYFGQLLGMADPLTYVLGANGYKVRSINLRIGTWHQRSEDVSCTAKEQHAEALPPAAACSSYLHQTAH